MPLYCKSFFMWNYMQPQFLTGFVLLFSSVFWRCIQEKKNAQREAEGFLYFKHFVLRAKQVQISG